MKRILGIVLGGTVGAVLIACSVDDTQSRNTLNAEVTSSLTTVCIKNASIVDWEGVRVTANDEFVLALPDGSFVVRRWEAGETRCEIAVDFLYRGGQKTRLTDKCCFDKITIEANTPADGRWSGPS